MRRKLYDERGIAMIAVIMALLVVALLSTAVLSMASSNVKNSLVEREYQSTYYIAEAGMTILTEKLKTDMDDIWLTTSNATDFFQELENIYLLEQAFDTMFISQYEHQPSVKVKLIKVAEPDPKVRTYMMVSRGTTENVTRTVTKNITIQWFPYIDLDNLISVFALGDMAILQGEVGDIGTNGTITVPRDGAFPFPGTDRSDGTGAWPKVGNYYVDVSKIPNSVYQTVGIQGVKPQIGDDWNDKSWIDGQCGTKQDLTEEREYPLPYFPLFPDDIPDAEKLNHDNTYGDIVLDNQLTYYKNITLTSNQTITINYNGDSSLVVDNLNIPSGNIKLNDNGSNGVLTLYIRNNITFASTEINQPSGGMTEIGAANKLVIYYKGIADFTVNDNTKLYGNFYADHASVDINDGGKHVGNIVTGGSAVNIEGGASTTNQLIYAPNAYVVMGGAGTVYGPVVARDFLLSGSGKVLLGPGELLPNPYFPEKGSDLIAIEGATREQ